MPRSRDWVFLAVPAVFAGIWLAGAAAHDRFVEFDGIMQLASGRGLLDTGRYEGWASHFWPPLYPLLTATLAGAAGGFWAAKLVSGLAAAGLLIVVYHFAREIGGTRRPAVAAQAVVALIPIFYTNAIQAQNHMLDAFLVVTAIWLLVRLSHRPNPSAALLAGAVAGVAVMARYQSAVLAVVAIAAIALAPGLVRPQRVRLLVAFGAAMAVPMAPWIVQNWVLNGSPVATLHHLNVGSSLLDPDNSFGRWWWNGQAAYPSLGSVVRAAPAAYLENIGHNLVDGAEHVFWSSAAALPLAAAGLVHFVKRPAGRIVAAFLGGFLLLVSQAFLRDYFFIAPAALVTVLGIVWADRAIAARRGKGVAAAAFVVLAATMVLMNGALTVIHARSYLRGYNAAAVEDLEGVAAALRRDPDIGRRIVMASSPAYALAAGARFAMAPLYYEGNPEGYVLYRGIPDVVLRYAPRIPTSMPDDALRADYLVINQMLASNVRQLVRLTHTRRPPPGFTLIYRNDTTAVYRIA